MEYEGTYQRAFKTYEDFGARGARPARELNDTPPPIVYNDEFGRSVVVFHRIRTGKYGMPVFDITYQDEGRSEEWLLDLAQEGFYFAETKKHFGTLSQFGDPLMFFNYNMMASSRHHLLSLGHEMGHSRQRKPVNDLLQIVRPQFAKPKLSALLKQYSHLTEYIRDLELLVAISQETDHSKRLGLARKVTNGGTKNGAQIRDIDPDFTQLVEEVIAHIQNDTPLDFAHPPGLFNVFSANLPAVYSIIDPMVERLAWEYAVSLDKSFNKKGVMHCGFQLPEEQVDFMRNYLSTYDHKYNVANYTRWLLKL